jgi:hypothetical protein
MSNGWDNNSGIRERLALLAAQGPTLTPNDWGYNPSRDVWYQSSDRAIGSPVKRIEVKQEGSASLDIIERSHGLNYSAAMAFIGHPVT